MKIVIQTFFALALSLLTSCGNTSGDEANRYQIIESKQGVVRLDKKTGEMALVRGDQLKRIKTPEEIEIENTIAELADEDLLEPRIWPQKSFAQIGIDVALLKSQWARNAYAGSLTLNLELRPLPEWFASLERAESLPITLVFSDDQGLKVSSVPLSVENTTTLVDRDNSKLGISVDASTPMQGKDLRRTHSWTLVWASSLGAFKRPPDASKNNGDRLPKTELAMPNELAMSRLLELKSAIIIYKIENGKIPAALADLLATTSRLPEGCIPGYRSVPNDPWDRAFIYEIAKGANGEQEFRLRSTGPNGKDEKGSGDDLVAK